MKKQYSTFILLLISALIMFSCEEESTEPDNKAKRIEDLKPRPNNGLMKAQVGGTSVSTDLIVAGVFINGEYPGLDNILVGGFAIADGDTTHVSFTLTGDFAQLQINTFYTNDANRMIQGFYSNTSNQLIGGGTATIRFDQLDRDEQKVSGSFSFIAEAFNLNTQSITSIPISCQFTDVEYIIITEE